MDAFELLVEAHRPAIKPALAKLVGILHAQKARYVIGGANALSLYVRPRMTVDVDAFVDPVRKNEIDKAFAAEFELVSIGMFHSKFKHADVEIDILYAGLTPRISPWPVHATRSSSARRLRRHRRKLYCGSTSLPPRNRISLML